MNIIFGSSYCSGSNSSLRRVQSYLKSKFNADAVVIQGAKEASACFIGYISDHGSIVGIAEKSNLTFLFIGNFFGNPPDWKGPGSPIDDPNSTAAYLLDRFIEQGETFLDGLCGHYALVVFEPTEGKILLAVDPFGGRSLFVFNRGNKFCFSSNVRVLAEILGDDLQIDRDYEDFMLIYGFYPFGRTPYKDVCTQESGQIITWSKGTVDQVKIKKALPNSKSDDANKVRYPETAITQLLYEAFEKSTIEILPSRPCKVAVLLGGFDSALVAAMITRLGFEVETFSFYYSDERYNQPHIDTLTNQLGIRHHWVGIDRNLIESGLEGYASIFNLPTNWPNYVIQTAHLCKEIRESGINYCYSGDGCDAVFLGYPGTYQRARLLGAIPALSEHLNQLLISAASVRWLERNVGHPYRVFLGLVRAKRRSTVAQDSFSFRVMDDLTLKQLRKQDLQQPESLDAIVERLSNPFTDLPQMRRAYLGKAAVSPNKNKLIGSADVSGVPILSPYLHPTLKQFALALPVELMRPEVKGSKTAMGKFILMRMAEEKALLPKEVIHQPKVAAVDAPIDDWYAGPMREVMKRMISGLPFDYNERYLDRLIDQKFFESLFKRFVLTDKVISHAVSLLATYASFTGLEKNHSLTSDSDSESCPQS